MIALGEVSEKIFKNLQQINEGARQINITTQSLSELGAKNKETLDNMVAKTESSIKI
ncbi:MAG TPA: hypothetical protein PLG34_02715 [Spirochaetota bacterium]|jgi:hypothetical protein|nr:hypothetical protein [Spirochaetota bacterium]HPY86877.1 hypothetical protein [Spirochaetota bacterium]HQB61638.1 hypothetical protein [Spirochaetota bacterium]